jgi:hypothetical protein
MTTGVCAEEVPLPFNPTPPPTSRRPVSYFHFPVRLLSGTPALASQRQHLFVTKHSGLGCVRKPVV